MVMDGRDGASVKPVLVDPYHSGSVVVPAGLVCGEYPVSFAPGEETVQSHQKTPFIHAVSALKTSKKAS
jgi:hypothetical protein